MNNRIRLCVGLMMLLLNAGVYAQTEQPSVLFENYKKDKTTSPLPDFSYAGYRSGEKAIPKVKRFRIFNVLDYGAKPNDNISDREAIQTAIDSANRNGSGIVFFPKGRFLVNEDSTLKKGIFSRCSNIIFRGSGSGPGGTELYMKEMLLPANPKDMWTGPPMFTFTTNGKDEKIGEVIQSVEVGETKLRLNKTGSLQVGDWIALKLLDNSPSLINEELAPKKADSTWTYIVKKGVDVCMYYQVTAIKKGFITLHAPLAYKVDAKYIWTVDKFANAEEIGIEDIAFVGNWKEKFVHHGSWKHDSGFNLFMFSRCTNSWMRNCRFTDCSIAAIVGQSANVTVINCFVTGNAGHEAITSNHSTNVLLANLTDEASQWHSFGTSHGAVNTVLWHCTYPSSTCFESHASQPRNTLLDNVTGGFMSGRQGGAIENLPNHLGGLVFWNYTQTSPAIRNYDFWPEKDVWIKLLPPVIAGFKGNGTTFRNENLKHLEGLDQFVFPLSLYEAQLELRLKKAPEWLKKAKQEVK